MSGRYSTIIGPRAGPVFFTRNIKGITSRNSIPINQNASVKANMPL